MINDLKYYKISKRESADVIFSVLCFSPYPSFCLFFSVFPVFFLISQTKPQPNEGSRHRNVWSGGACRDTACLRALLTSYATERCDICPNLGGWRPPVCNDATCWVVVARVCMRTSFIDFIMSAYWLWTDTVCRSRTYENIEHDDRAIVITCM